MMKVPTTELPFTKPNKELKTMVMSLFNHKSGMNGSPWMQLIREGKAKHLLIVAIDIGKFTHKVMMANIFEDELVAPFEVDASWTGFLKVREKVQDICNAVGFKEVVVGIETTAHYYEDITRFCFEAGYLVRIINAATIALERNAQLNWTKTDNVDLKAIVRAVVQGRGYPVKQDNIGLETLRKLTRFRRNLVQHQTQLTSQLRMLMDHIFREFQGKSVWIDRRRVHKKPFSNFITKSSLYLMRHYPHFEDILALGKDGLRDVSVQNNLKLRNKTISCLLEFAEDSASKPKALLEAELLQLQFTLDSYEHVAAQLKSIEKKIENQLLKTDGGILLSIPGLGVTTVAELTAEMGPLDTFTNANQLIKMAGTNPLVKQSGGHRPTYSGISKQGRKQFRNIVYLVGKCVSTANPEMRKRYLQMVEKGKATRAIYIALGNRILRLAFAMIRKKSLYISNDPDYRLKTSIRGKLSTIAAFQAFYDRFVTNEVSLVS